MKGKDSLAPSQGRSNHSRPLEVATPSELLAKLEEKIPSFALKVMMMINQAQERAIQMQYLLSTVGKLVKGGNISANHGGSIPASRTVHHHRYC